MSWRDYSLTRMNLLFDLSECYLENNIDIYTDPTIARMIHEMEMMVYYLKEKEFDINDLASINAYRYNKGYNPLKISDIYNYLVKLEERIIDFKNKYSLPF